MLDIAPPNELEKEKLVLWLPYQLWVMPTPAEECAVAADLQIGTGAAALYCCASVSQHGIGSYVTNSYFKSNRLVPAWLLRKDFSNLKASACCRDLVLGFGKSCAPYI